MEHNNGGLYAIIDELAESIVGFIHIHRNAAAAVRMFVDIATDERTNVHKHAADYVLVRLGYLTTDNKIVPGHEVIMRGSDILASLPPKTTDNIAPTQPTLVKENQ